MNAATMGVEIIAHTPNPLDVIYTAARQCYSGMSSWEITDSPVSAEKKSELVRSVVRSGHFSVTEHVSFTFGVWGVSRAFSHQLVRHRIASYSQQSQRYVDARDMRFVVPPAIAEVPEALAVYEAHMDNSIRAYERIAEILEENGRAARAKEDARFVLPNGGETKLVYTMNCRGLFNFFAHRCCRRAQWEIRAVAAQMLTLVNGILPAVFDESSGAPCERTKTCPEGERGCGLYPPALFG